MYTEEDLLPISALQHLIFCERQCALIHIEQAWAENLFTAEGRIMHERVHTEERESRGKIRIEYGMSLRSLRLGLIGKADVVEFHCRADGSWQPFPVEYKRGKPKKDNSDKVQLCAQALCLEEMMDVAVPDGALFYGKTRRRLDVVFDGTLRKLTEDTAMRLHELIESGRTPRPVYAKKCDSCSLAGMCLPKTLGKKSLPMRGRGLKHTIGGIVCFGNVGCSPFLMGFCAERDVAISFLSEYGRFLARVQGPVSGNVLLRREQYRKADDLKASADIAKAVLTGKIANCRTVLRRALRDHGDKPDADKIQHASKRLAASLKSLAREESLDAVRGIEGDAARAYFNVFDHLIISQRKDFSFHERSRRPPLDNVNCLLSFLYTLVMHDVRSALETVGLDPAVGFLHRDRPGRPGLALDMMEEFRPFIADRMALSLINLSQVQKKGFDKSESGAVLMDDETRKTLLVAYQNRKQDEIMHPFLNEKVTIGLLFHTQALLLARYLRGDLDGYPPFIWK